MEREAHRCQSHLETELVIIGRMEDYLTNVSEETLVAVGALEAYLLCPTDVVGPVDVLAKKACVIKMGAESLYKGRTFGGRREAVCDPPCKY